MCVTALPNAIYKCSQTYQSFTSYSVSAIRHSILSLTLIFQTSFTPKLRFAKIAYNRMQRDEYETKIDTAIVISLKYDNPIKHSSTSPATFITLSNSQLQCSSKGNIFSPLVVVHLNFSRLSAVCCYATHTPLDRRWSLAGPYGVI